MRATIFIISLFLTTTVFAQYTVTLDAFVLDAETKESIPYVNIQCVGKDIKGVTNNDGQFTIKFDEEYVNNHNNFEFAVAGYETLTIEMSKLSAYLSANDKIYLSPKKQKLQHTISGVVYNEDKQSVQNAVVRKKNTFTEVQTNVDGTFTIPAEIGDVLEVNFIGMNPYKVVVATDKPLAITLTSSGELLNAVELEGEKRKKNKRYVDTGFGKIDIDNYGIGSVVTSEQIGLRRVYITDVLRGRIAGLQVSAREGNSGPRFGMVQSISLPVGVQPTQTEQPVLKIRGQRALVFYDGAPFYGNINDINVNTVDNIVIVRGLSRTVLYGGRPAVLITSKNRFIKRDADGNIINPALVTGNDYKESVPVISQKDTADYMTALKTATTYEEALAIYTVQSRKAKHQTVPYYIDVSEYFMKWNKEKSIAIMATIEKIAGNNPKALKVLAYKLEAVDEFEKAKHIYQKIATLLPNASQSYRDLAMIYTKAGNYQESLDLYVKMLTNSFENIDFSGLDKPMLNEIQQLLRKHRVQLNYKDIPSNLLTGTFKHDVRIVVEWNQVDTEFELQFVNPRNKFHTWEHSVAANKESMIAEVKNGYYMKEFIIDDVNNTGEWIINVKTLQTEKAFNPTYLKYTVYKNYGAPNEERAVKVVKLYKQQQKVTLDKIQYQSVTVAQSR